MTPEQFKEKIAIIYATANELGREFNISTCTPDGHLIGAIGQIAAKIAFGLELGSKLTEHNATVLKDGKKLNIQVRATGRGSIALREEPCHLICLNISSFGSIQLLYNGPGEYVWTVIKHQTSKQKSVSAKQLEDVQRNVKPGEELIIKENIFSNVLIESERSGLKI